MSARAVHLVIDARPRGPRGLLAAEAGTRPKHARSPARTGGRAGDAERTRRRACAAGRTPTASRARRQPGRGEVVFVNGPPRADANVLRTDRFYDAKRLRRDCGEADRRNPPCYGGWTGLNPTNRR